jgi:light-regulated signal transduction histidine kinase (bacteriophytochrome)
VGSRGQTPAPVELEIVLARVLTDLRISLEEGGVTVTHDPLPTVLGDESQLGQLFQNLLANAIKFRGPEAPRIHIGAERTDSHWTLAVRDNGIGIAPEHRERIFLIFQRLHTRAEYPGTGIGLAIARRIVERHGGRIWIESNTGPGTTFCFTVPASPPRRLRGEGS